LFPAAGVEGAEDAVDHLELADRRRVVGLDPGCLKVGVAEELLLALGDLTDEAVAR
jgi:hypothetical protein